MQFFIISGPLYSVCRGDNITTAKKGDKVDVEYTGTLSDGTQFDSSKGRAPLTFELGSGQVIKGFDAAVEGMNEGDSKTINIPKVDAYGDSNPQLIQEVPRSAIPTEMEVNEGMVLGLHSKDGSQQIPARVVKVTPESITIDINHPLAGKDLTFELKLVKVH
ncbi:MAG: peptidylprolyl isomerase [Candidatus Woesearchaeota archaeon]